MNDTCSWLDLFDYHFAKIESDSADLLSSPTDNIEDELIGEEDEQEIDEDDEYEREIRSEWMLLAEMGPDTVIDKHSDLGSREMDRNHDWIGNFRRRHPNLNIEDVSTFLQQVREEDTTDAENSIINTVDFQTLNDKQKIIFKQIEVHYIASIDDPSHIESLKIIIMGTAGTGKSYLIQAIRCRLLEIARNNGLIIKSPILVLALTGVAAFNIHGATIHSALSIPVNSSNFDIGGERLK